MRRPGRDSAQTNVVAGVAVRGLQRLPKRLPPKRHPDCGRHDARQPVARRGRGRRRGADAELGERRLVGQLERDRVDVEAVGVQLEQQVVVRLQRVGEVALDGVLAEPRLPRGDLVDVELVRVRGRGRVRVRVRVWVRVRVVVG